MNTKLFLFIFGLILAISCEEKTAQIMPLASTIEIDDNDTKDSIIIKAAHVIPTPNQYEALKNEFIAFIHFGQIPLQEWNGEMEWKIQKYLTFKI